MRILGPPPPHLPGAVTGLYNTCAFDRIRVKAWPAVHGITEASRAPILGGVPNIGRRPAIVLAASEHDDAMVELNELH
jgi:hypothetical protein